MSDHDEVLRAGLARLKRKIEALAVGVEDRTGHIHKGSRRKHHAAKME
jgi:hypothetical protein